MEARIKVAESEGVTLNIYPRAGSGTFYYEIRDCSHKHRGSLGTKDEIAARTNALTLLASHIERKRRGLPAKSVRLETVAADFIASREAEYERSELSIYTLRQNKTVLNTYFVAWMKAHGLADLSEVKDIGPYVEWRKTYRRDAEHSYMRSGKEVTGQRCAKHFKPINAASINKENNTLRVFFRWAERSGHIPKGSAPTIEMLKDTVKVRVPERIGRTGRLARGEAATVEDRHQEINYGNWLHVEEFAKLRQTAWQIYKWEATKHELSKRRFPWMHKRRHPNGGVSQRVKNWRAFYCWLMIMVNTGMRPVEFRNLTWDRVKPYKFADGRIGREVWVIGKGKLRPVVVEPEVAIYFDRLAWLTAQKPYEELLTDKETMKGYVFSLPDFSGYLRDTLKKAKMETKGRNQYTLRHTFINWQLLYTDVKPSDLSIIVGNSDRVIREYYNHITPFLLAERSSNVVRQHGRFLKLDK